MSREMSAKAVMVQRERDDGYRFTGPAPVLRQIIFHIGDLVWPGWFENAKGRETYIQYADTAAKSGFMLVAGGKYFCSPERYEEVKRRLKEADIEVFEAT